jgi:hypothetical protein
MLIKKFWGGKMFKYILSWLFVFLFFTAPAYAQKNYNGSIPGTIVRIEVVDKNSGWPIEGVQITFKDNYGSSCGSITTGEDGIAVFGISTSMRDPTKIEVRVKNYYSLESVFPLARLRKHTANTWQEPLTDEERSNFKFEYNPSEAYYINVKTSTDSVEEYFEKVIRGEYNQYYSGGLLIPIKIRLEKIPKERR